MARLDAIAARPPTPPREGNESAKERDLRARLDDARQRISSLLFELDQKRPWRALVQSTSSMVGGGFVGGGGGGRGRGRGGEHGVVGSRRGSCGACGGGAAHGEEVA